MRTGAVMREQHRRGMYFLHPEVKHRQDGKCRWMEDRMEVGVVMEATMGWDEMEVEGTRVGKDVVLRTNLQRNR